jgi:predicted dehydrogenase
MKLQIGIIGYKNHALRLIELISKNKYCKLKVIYHPNKKVEHELATNKIDDLYKCDAVLISSPNQTHFDYIVTLLDNFNGYIFCEKPPVCCLSHIEALFKIKDADKCRTYFNYNLRFGCIGSIINDSHYLEKLGTIQYIKILLGHGLAFKDDYLSSWRADGKLNLHSITETVAIHYVDLLKFNYGEVRKSFYSPSIVANTGTAFDTTHISLSFDKVTASIFASYACPFVDDVTIIGTNGIIRVSEDYLYLYNPRDTFDKNGYFIAPPLIEKKVLNTNDEYMNSLSKSLYFFISHVHKGDSIDTKYFNIGLSSNKFLLEMQNSSKSIA